MVFMPSQGHEHEDVYMGEARPRSVDRRTLVTAVTDDLVAWLREGEVQVGEKLPTMPVLMEMFDVGLSTIREAVKALAYVGILEVTAGRGTFLIAHPDEIQSLPHYLRRAEGAQLDDLRRMLEARIARLAAENREDDDVAEIAELAARCDEVGLAGDPKRLAEADYDFHMAVCRAARHDVYTYLYRNLRSLVREDVRRREAAQLAGIVHGMNVNHARLVSAIKAGDADEAFAIWEIADDCFDGDEGATGLREKR